MLITTGFKVCFLGACLPDQNNPKAEFYLNLQIIQDNNSFPFFNHGDTLLEPTVYLSVIEAMFNALLYSVLFLHVCLKIKKKRKHADGIHKK